MTRPDSVEIEIGDQDVDEIAKMADFFADVRRLSLSFFFLTMGLIGGQDTKWFGEYQETGSRN